MNWNDTQKQYGIVTKSLHWATALLILAQFVLGLTMASLPRNDIYATIWGANRVEWYGWHQSSGILLIIVVLARLVWRRYATLPDWAAGLTPFERKYAHKVERVLYWLMLLTPLSGILSTIFEVDHLFFFGLNIPTLVSHNESIAGIFGLFHVITRNSLIVVLLLHIGLVLKHQFVNKDRLLNRMLPFTSDKA